MFTTLVVLTVVEILALVVVLATYLILVTRRLRSVSQSLARVAFGVRAVETQLNVLEPGVTTINGTLREINEVLPRVAEKAEELAG